MTLYTLTITDGTYTFTPQAAESGAFWVSWPVEQKEPPRITSKFNDVRDYGKHEGIDCDGYINATASLAAVVAAQDGIVEYVNTRTDANSYGKHIVIRHPWNGESDRYRTLYGHLSSIMVKAGDVVERGHVIGIAGNSGTTAIHLHFNVHDAKQGLRGYVRCKDCSGLFPDGVIDPETVLRM